MMSFDVRDFRKGLDFLKNTPSVKLEDYQEVKNCLFETLFNKVSIIITKIPKGTILYRSVPIQKNRHDLTHGTKRDLSYRPDDIPYDKFNRCSEPNQSHFYCSSDSSLSLMECSYYISQAEQGSITNSPNDEELLEMGGWFVQEDLTVVDLRYGDFTHSGTERFHAENTEKYKQLVKESALQEFFQFINRSFENAIIEKDHTHYWLTACYSSYLFRESFKPHPKWAGSFIQTEKLQSIDGLLYHSVKGIQATPSPVGYNVVLNKRCIDTNQLTLIKAGIFKIKQIGPKEFIFGDVIKQNLNISGSTWTYE
ncbi:hypothetical protein M1D52_20415 [Olivibacter sp. SA151]|uniref:hypothetical protein n=1 Tax=Olivibacter jilunii TaxID=985016 RepID=UPI003F177426